ncbi:hypothetical protein ALC60_13574 [Trachymyrmex zeteki]|uniref:Uncharacterized protein n=1 Tax=Mycetomoellerius zeteki TaxID=64791 RepID=A0A151WHZ1_9HYME|nr:hypothetical protein ALC60_13574 [Trachymyrmex zeteki]
MRRGGSRYVREDATSSVRLPGRLHREHTATIAAAAATAAPR